MANHPTPQPVARVGDDPTIRRLRELAAQEAAATKERLATRTAAARCSPGPWPGLPRPRPHGSAPKPKLSVPRPRL